MNKWLSLEISDNQRGYLKLLLWQMIIFIEYYTQTWFLQIEE